MNLLPALAQETTGGINGHVKDKSGAAIAKAQVELSSQALLTAKKMDTDNAGYFYFQQLPPGTYILTVTAPNFRTFRQTGIALEVGKLPTFEIGLEVGALTETVEVSGQSPIVDVTTSKVAVDIPREVIDNLPKGRSYQSLIPLAPGARQEPLQSSRVDRMRQDGFQIDGASDGENTYLVEGLDTSNIQNGGIKQNVIFEFVDQVQVKTSGTEAEYGGAMGGVVNVIQKRGSNDWHGGLVAYYRANALDANDQCSTTPQPVISESVVPSGQQLACGQRYDPGTAVNNAARLDQATIYYNQKQDHYRTVEAGYEIGGPLYKNKLWLFSSYIPTIDRIQRSVLFTGAASPGLHTFYRSDTVHNMLNRLDYQPFSSLHLFGSWQYGYHRIVGQLPTLPDSNNGQANPIAGQDPASFRSDTGSVNPSNIFNFGGDWTINSRTILAVRYGYFYYNSEDRGLPSGIRDIYQTDLTPGVTTSPIDGAVLAPTGSAGAAFAHPAGFANISANLTNLHDIFSRKAFSADLSHSVSKWGTHNFKFGYGFNHLYNDVFQGINTARINIFYGQKYTPSTPAGVASCGTIAATNSAGVCAGEDGYFTIMDGITTVGKAQSYNHGVYGEDSWNVGLPYAEPGRAIRQGIRPALQPGQSVYQFWFHQQDWPTHRRRL
jgi:hypothetical protein